MIFTTAGIYQALTVLPTYSTAGYTTPTGGAFQVGDKFEIVRTQENVKGLMEWGELKAGGWVTLLQNGKPRVKLVTVIVVNPPPPPPDVPPVVTGAVHVIKVSANGTLSIDGLDYE